MKVLFILLVTFSVFHVHGQNNLPTTKANEKSFPTNLSEENFKMIKNFDGQVVAFDATIEKCEVSRNKTPFYKLKISRENSLWTVLMFKNENNKIGDTVRVVGYLRPVSNKSEMNKKESQYLDGEFMVIAFGLLDLKNSNFLFLNGASEQKKEWIDGKIPSSK